MHRCQRDATAGLAAPPTDRPTGQLGPAGLRRPAARLFKSRTSELMPSRKKPSRSSVSLKVLTSFVLGTPPPPSCFLSSFLFISRLFCLYIRYELLTRCIIKSVFISLSLSLSLLKNKRGM